MPQSPILLLLSAVGGAVAIVAAALIAGWLSRRIKISEFRQTWINDLRTDIAAYVAAARVWWRQRQITNGITDATEKEQQEKKLYDIATDAKVILWRIKLRINPRSNIYRARDDLFLQKLDGLITLEKVPSENADAYWEKLASEAVDAAREILKREWEVTKGRSPSPSWWLSSGGLVLGMVGVMFVFIWGPPQPSFERGVPVTVENGTVLSNGRTALQNDLDIAALEAHYRSLSEFGLTLIFCGFLCQLGAALVVKE